MIYTVKPGDTLTGILLAQGYCKLSGPRGKVDSWTECLNLAIKVGQDNGLEDINHLTPGQQLRLPDLGEKQPGMPTAEAGPGSGSSWLILLLLGLFGAVVWLGSDDNDDDSGDDNA